ncbi:MAG TPA: hypothetical protein VKB93_14300 [Thermoanaerobaculia bacterium]|nr:hypothetical protein [Thermoanaerobaculia bacterium]
MLLELVFTTRLLGLVSGDQGIEVRVEKNVRAVDIMVDGERVAKLDPPYRVVLNFGSGIVPHELTSVAYDEHGNEVGRDTQLVNLARRRAEANIELNRDPRNGRLRANVRWEHIVAERPRRIELKLDGKLIASEATAYLPPLPTDYALHLLEAKVEWSAGTTATKELVFGGRYSEEQPAELTGIIAKETSECFQSGERVVHAAAIEKPDAIVYFVRSGDAGVARRKLRNLEDVPLALNGMKLTYIWPAPQLYRVGPRRANVDLFDGSNIVPGDTGTGRLLTQFAGPDTGSDRFADAVAVAAVQALAGAKRRAVVLVLGGERDDSQHTAGAVRRYLERIGVPLRVWSLIGVTPQMTTQWGDVRDISNPELLRDATEELQALIDEQRIAWLALQPMAALKAKPVDCM